MSRAVRLLPRLTTPATPRVLRMAVGLAVYSAIVGSASLVSGRPTQFAGTALPDDGQPQGSCAIWFVGSSSIRRWQSLATDMAPWIAHNRGVDGATIRQLTNALLARAPATSPQAIIFYGGDNDLAYGQSADAAVRDLHDFVAAARQVEGRPPTFLVSVKPSPGRWSLRGEQAGFNRAARAIAAADPSVSFIDIAPRMLTQGEPGPFYAADGLHMNQAGYAIWRTGVRQALADRLPRNIVRACTRTRGKDARLKQARG